MVFLAFCLIYSHVYVLALQISGWSETEVGPSYTIPKVYGRYLFAHPSPPLPLREELSWAGKFLLGAVQCRLLGWDYAGRRQWFFLPFSCGCSQVFCSTVLLKFLKWAPRAILVCGQLSNYWSLLEDEAGGLNLGWWWYLLIEGNIFHFCQWYTQNSNLLEDCVFNIFSEALCSYGKVQKSAANIQVYSNKLNTPREPTTSIQGTIRNFRNKQE